MASLYEMIMGTFKELEVPIEYPDDSLMNKTLWVHEKKFEHWYPNGVPMIVGKGPITEWDEGTLKQARKDYSRDCIKYPTNKSFKQWYDMLVYESLRRKVFRGKEA